jgi:hypothetical protein
MITSPTVPTSAGPATSTTTTPADELPRPSSPVEDLHALFQSPEIPVRISLHATTVAPDPMSWMESTRDDAIDEVRLDSPSVSGSDIFLPPSAAFERPEPIFLQQCDAEQYEDSSHTERISIRHNPLVAAGDMLEKFHTSSMQLWNSVDGPNLLEHSVTDGWDDLATAMVMLIGEMRYRPTKLGEDPITVDPFSLFRLCGMVSSSRYMNHITRQMEIRISNRLSRTYTSYMDPFRTIYTNHPLANLAYACPLDSIELKSVVLNHRIGRHIRSEMQWFRSYDLDALNDDSNFNIRDMLILIVDQPALALIRGVEIIYTNEIAVGEGVTRDWYGKVVDRMLNPENGFFELGTEGVYRVNTTNGNSESMRRFYRAVGRIVALSLIESLPLGVTFNRGFYQVLLGKDEGWTDIDLYKDAGIGVFTSWARTANCSRDASCEALMVPMVSLDLQRELVPGGFAIDITSSNCAAWGELALNDHMYAKTRVAFQAIHAGMTDLLLERIIREILHPEDLREILTGNINISVDGLFDAMHFTGGLTSESPLVIWLREILEENDASYRSKFLFFVTGIKALPHGGFGGDSRRIQVGTSSASPDHLPTAHTCFLQLELPNYASKEQLREKMTLAIHNPDMTMY